MEAIGEDASLRLDQTRPVETVRQGYSFFQEGDVAFAKVTPCFENGKAAVMSGLVEGAGFGTTEVTIARATSRIINRFLFYVLTEDRFRQLGQSAMTGAGGLKRVPDLFTKNFAFPLPSLREQQRIVNFLDRETAQIDELIARQEHLIELLAEKRQAVITHAVTKGLDPTASTKPSGTPWLGDIPAHWSSTRVKFTLSRIEQGVSPQADAVPADSESWGVLKSGCVNGGTFVEDENKQLPIDFTIDPAIVVEVGDLLVSRASGSPKLVGSAARVRNLSCRLILSDKTFRFRVGSDIDPDFLEWFLNSRPYREQVEGSISGAEGLANNISTAALKNIRCAIPPLDEQIEIATEVRRKTDALGLLERAARMTIQLLRERRSALISAAVTGKIDVSTQGVSA